MLIDILSAKISEETLRALTSALGLLNAFATFAVLQVLGRRLLVRWRKWSWAALLFLWLGIVPTLLELIYPINQSLGGVTIANLGTKLGLLFWLTGLAILLVVSYRVLAVDVIGFGKPKGIFVPEEEFGVPVIDKALSKAHEQGKKLYFPVLLIGERSINPHRFAQRFLMKAIQKGGCGIYFTFTRPPETVISQLSRAGFNPFTHSRQLIIIDACTPIVASGRSRKKAKSPDFKNVTVVCADPRNPHDVNRKYERALRMALSRGPSPLRVVYDSFSDFLLFSYPELMMTYLRHNMVWEEMAGVESIYILWPETLDKPVKDVYLVWFANTPIWLKTEGDHVQVTISSLFDYTAQYAVNHQYEQL